MKRLMGLTAVLLAAALALSGCKFSVYSLPLPGGADVGSHPITVTVNFADVLDLVPQSTVKVADVTVGKVTDVQLDGYTAKVTMLINGDVNLPDNVNAELRQTSLLGEKFVSLSAPATGATGRLSNGDVIPIEHTGRNPEVEEVLGALSLVLNGGGVAQLHTIASELNNALKGREGSTRSVLEQLKLLMGQLDSSKGDIVKAIDGINRVSVAINSQRSSIDSALQNLPAAFTSLNSQRADLVKMLQALDQLGKVGVRVINASKNATIDTFRSLTPILSKLQEAGKAFPYSLNVFLTYPFVDEVVGRNPTVARNLHMGDYTNLSVKLDVNVPTSGGPPPTSLPTNLPSIINPSQVLDDVTKCLQSGNPASPACQRVFSNAQELLQLQKECQKPANKNKDVCKQLNSGGLPTLPGLPSPTSGGPLPSIPGLPRPASGPTTGTSQHGVSMAYLMSLYDADLVSLMLPSLVVS